MQPEVPEAAKIEKLIIPEEEKPEVTQPEPIEGAVTARESSSIQILPSSEVQALSEQNVTPLQESEPVPVSLNSIPNNMVYVPGFGWTESQGPNHRDLPKIFFQRESLLL